MNRIESIFENLRASRSGDGSGGRALMPYVTVGDPDLETTTRLLPVMERAGARICELGIPFSDPIADGPVIESSMHYALSHGVKLKQIFEMIKRVRAEVELGLVGMLSYSIVHRYGEDAFIADAKDAGLDGFIVPDLMVEESADFAAKVKDAGLIMSMLISPTTEIERAKEIAQQSSGFVYVLARAGITGEQKEMPAELGARIAALREATDLPIAVGFGISNADHVRTVVSEADAAIVGSALVRRIGEHRNEGSDAVVAAVEEFTSELASGLST
ncbi:tryptophan synthase subunit alpha [Poriferisphaera sp. WC338]|uniref:tryptophan synthase subunit alpha n=1 Tax=Poriferisphaera sp. WC338 TaxID=3425129 RepID=UPI003D813124